mmetsp:Transcript_44893/g.143815  ORF Transcript_44893/g.143815 Transcript_44893/m.143815 type:complete len:563 (-) Transcript_44893:64-1752(-)
MVKSLGAEGRAQLTVLQGGFSVGHRVTFVAPRTPQRGRGGSRASASASSADASAAGTLRRWLEAKGCWEVSVDGAGTLALQASELKLEGCAADEVAEELPLEEGEVDEKTWRGRQVVSNPELGDLVEIFYRGAWLDASIVALPEAAVAKSTKARAGGSTGSRATGAAGRSRSRSRSRSPRGGVCGGSSSSSSGGGGGGGGSGGGGGGDGLFRVVLLNECQEVSVPVSKLRRKENYLQHRRRLQACAVARIKLKAGTPISDDDVLEVLRVWSFTMNPVRKNVIPEGESWVFSDTMGLVRSRCTGKPVESRLSSDYPDILRLLSAWMRRKCGSKFPGGFPFTSVNLNFGYAAKLHRDGFNVGPSLLTALGDFTGGALGYFPALPPLRRRSVVTKNCFQLIDGKRAHCVEEFQGERFSVVFFSVSSHRKTGDAVRRGLVRKGAVWPTQQSLAKVTSLLKPPRGYTQQRKASPKAAASKRPAAAEGSPPAKSKAGGAKKDAAEEPKPAPVDRYRLLKHPHLALNLQIQHVYTMPVLVRKCKGRIQKITALRRKLMDPETFEPLGPQ